MTQFSKLGQTLDSSRLKNHLKYKRYDQAVRLMDAALSSTQNPEQDPSYIQFLGVLSTSLLRSGNHIGADAVFDRIKAKIQPAEYPKEIHDLCIELQAGLSKVGRNFHLSAKEATLTPAPQAANPVTVTVKKRRTFVRPDQDTPEPSAS